QYSDLALEDHVPGVAGIPLVKDLLAGLETADFHDANELASLSRIQAAEEGGRQKKANDGFQRDRLTHQRATLRPASPGLHRRRMRLHDRRWRGHSGRLQLRVRRRWPGRALPRKIWNVGTALFLHI